jgi:hypothetical protein
VLQLLLAECPLQCCLVQLQLLLLLGRCAIVTARWEPFPRLPVLLLLSLLLLSLLLLSLIRQLLQLLLLLLLLSLLRKQLLVPLLLVLLMQVLQLLL